MHFYSCAEMALICQAVQLQLVVFSFHQLAPILELAMVMLFLLHIYIYVDKSKLAPFKNCTVVCCQCNLTPFIYTLHHIDTV